MDIFNIVSVPIIVSVVYGSLTLFKKVMGSNEKVLKFIPLIAAVFGAVLGIVAFFAVPDIILADNVFTAMLVGGASGLAATGTNQIFKQLTKKDNAEDDGDGINEIG